MMNFFSAFSVKYQTQSFPQIVHRGGIPGLAEFPQGTWHRSCPQHWSLLENQESSQIHRVQRSAFSLQEEAILVFVSSTLGCNTSGPVSRARPAAHGDARISGPQVTQHYQGWGICLPESGLSGDSTPPQAALGNL